MSSKRLGVLSGSLICVALMIGVVQAAAATPTKVLKFFNPPGVQISVGFSENSNTPPPVGASQVIQVVLENVGSQFGKPSGTKVGHVLIDCTVLLADPSAQRFDGICSGIAHVPDGYITFGGNGGFGNGKVNYYAITGGVGHYAKDRGEIRTVKGGGATVTLYSP